MINSILTVCIGNICRSPMAEGLFSKSLPSLQVSSAGLGALVGHKPDALAIELMQVKGIDISNHIARQLNQTICAGADIILVMDKEQRRHIENKYPSARGKVFRLVEILDKDVPDPYRMGRSAFVDALELIEQGAGAWIERIKKLTEKERQLT